MFVKLGKNAFIEIKSLKVLREKKYLNKLLQTLFNCYYICLLKIYTNCDFVKQN